jgi:hypothetical protein
MPKYVDHHLVKSKALSEHLIDEINKFYQM